MKKNVSTIGVLVFFAIFGLIIGACSPRLDIAAIQGPIPSDTPAPVIVSSPTPLPSESPMVSPSPSPTATETPKTVTFKLGPNDDMFSIALYYGISLDALKTANPDQHPNALKVGSELIIPITPTAFIPTSTAEPESKFDPTSESTATLAPGQRHYPSYCYRNAMAAVYCFTVIHNDQDKAVENVTLKLTLSDETGKSAQAFATTLINVIPPHSSMPAASYFPPVWAEKLEAQAELDFELPFAEGESRYLEAEIKKQQIEMLYQDKAAKVSGTIVFENKQTSYLTLNVLAVAWAEDGAVLGMRRWSSVDNGSTSNEIPFDFNVYSMAGPIARVDLFVEAMAIPSEVTPTPTHSKP